MENMKGFQLNFINDFFKYKREYFLKIYIDESGNTGDLVTNNFDLGFSGQNIFTLSGIEIHDDLLTDLTERVIPDLITKHNIQGKELKSRQIFESKPRFLLQLLTKLNGKARVYSEIVEKRFYICLAIANHQICPFFYPQETLNGFRVQNSIYADLLAKNMKEKDYIRFFNSCTHVGENVLLESFKMIKSVARKNISNVPHGELYQGMLHNVKETEDDYKSKLKGSKSKEQVLKLFVPIPDKTKSGKQVNLLPQISCLTNIIASANYINESLESIEFIHDEQKQYDDILNDNINEMYELSGLSSRPKMYGVDYDLELKPEIEFNIKSHDNIGIQIADVISGFMMRYTKSILENKKLSPVHNEIFSILNSNNNHINYMLSMSDMKKMGIGYSRSVEMSYRSKQFESLYYDSL